MSGLEPRRRVRRRGLMRGGKSTEVHGSRQTRGVESVGVLDS